MRLRTSWRSGVVASSIKAIISTVRKRIERGHFFTGVAARTRAIAVSNSRTSNGFRKQVATPRRAMPRTCSLVARPVMAMMSIRSLTACNCSQVSSPSSGCITKSSTHTSTTLLRANSTALGPSSRVSTRMPDRTQRFGE